MQFTHSCRARSLDANRHTLSTPQPHKPQQLITGTQPPTPTTTRRRRGLRGFVCYNIMLDARVLACVLSSTARVTANMLLPTPPSVGPASTTR